MDIKDVVIVGAGPAGIATAIQLARYGIRYVLLEQGEVGGLLKNANLVENYPGFPHGISGLDLVGLFKKQLENVGLKVNFERVLEIEYKDKLFFTKTDRRIFKSPFVVIATGTRPKRIPRLTISDDVKKRIFYEIYPIRKTQNKKIAIIGAGDAAFDYALSLSGKNKVTILNRSGQTRCFPLLWSRCMKSKAISYLDNVSLKKIDDYNKKLQLTYTNQSNQNEKQIYADYVVVAIGRVPCLDFLGKYLKENLVNLTKMNTLYMVGDVKNKIYRQTAICVGDGIKAAMKIYRKMRKENG